MANQKWQVRILFCNTVYQCLNAEILNEISMFKRQRYFTFQIITIFYILMYCSNSIKNYFGQNCYLLVILRFPFSKFGVKLLNFSQYLRCLKVALLKFHVLCYFMCMETAHNSAEYNLKITELLMLKLFQKFILRK